MPARGQLVKENRAKYTYCLGKLDLKAKRTVYRDNIYLNFTLVIIRARLLFFSVPFFPIIMDISSTLKAPDIR